MRRDRPARRVALRRRENAPHCARRSSGPVMQGLDVAQERAIGVMPDHVSPHVVDRFAGPRLRPRQPRCPVVRREELRHLGRLNRAEDNRRALAATVGDFACVNADLIFDLAFVEPVVFLCDFEECCRAHVDQISTYPLLHFGHTPFGKSPHNGCDGEWIVHRARPPTRLARCLLEPEAGLEPTTHRLQGDCSTS